MPKFSRSSLQKLNTCHPDIIRLFEEVIKKYDFTVIFGARTVEEQFELFRQGRDLVGGKWIKTGKTVTNLDGKIKKSMHNYSPSLAIDVAPFPIDWNDISRFKHLANIVKETAKELGINIVWGGDWKTFKDYPHFELKV